MSRSRLVPSTRSTMLAACAILAAIDPRWAAAQEQTAGAPSPRIVDAGPAPAPPAVASPEEPNLTPGEALRLSLGITFGGAALGGSIAGLGLGIDVAAVAIVGGSIGGASLFLGPEVAHYATGHAGRGVVLWAIRQGIGLAGAGIGYLVEIAATGCSDGCGGDYPEGIIGLVVGGVVLNVLSTAYEFYDAYVVVRGDWEAYRSRVGEPGRSAAAPRFAVVPAVIRDARGGLGAGLALTLAL